MKTVIVSLLLVVVVSACAPSASGTQAARPRNPDVVTAAELDATRFPWLGDAVRAARPHLLSSRSVTSDVLVEVNGTMMSGGVAALQEVRTVAVQSVTRVRDGSVPHGGTLLRVRTRTGLDAAP